MNAPAHVLRSNAPTPSERCTEAAVVGAVPPLGRTLARLARRSPLCWMELGVPTDAGWHLAEDLLDDDSLQLASRLEALTRRFGHRVDVAASVLVESSARPVTLAATGAFFFERRVPHVAPAGIRLHVGTEELFDAVALDPGTAMTVLRGDPAGACPGVEEAAGLVELRQQLARHLVGYLAPLVAAVHRRSGKRTGPLWSTVAYTIASSLMILGRTAGEELRARTESGSRRGCGRPSDGGTTGVVLGGLRRQGTTPWSAGAAAASCAGCPAMTPAPRALYWAMRSASTGSWHGWRGSRESNGRPTPGTALRPTRLPRTVKFSSEGLTRP
jgi:hypothetical protein